MTSQDSTKPRISIIVPTFNRHDDLTRAVESLFDLNDEALTISELVIADNSPDANARPIFEELAKRSPIPVIYVSETTPGVSTVRNTALKQKNASLVAWLDDDQSVAQGWLDQLLLSHETYNATVVFGPTRTALPDETTKYRSYYTRFFERPQRAESGLIEEYFGVGNSLVDMDQIGAMLPDGEDVFDVKDNDLGGEDDRLFQMVLDKGGKITWNRDAIAFEHPPSHRISLDYTLKRSFSYGQGPCTLAMQRTPPAWHSVLFWMGVGAGQTGVYGTCALVTRLMGDEQWVQWADKAVRGLGKVLWFPPFQPRFYGASYLKRRKEASEEAEQPSAIQPNTVS